MLYARYIKRLLDILISGISLVILSPILLVLTAIGTVAMGGSPFFVQMRPGKIDKATGQEKLFRLVKFRSMSNRKDPKGNLLPDDIRLNKYGRILRSTSLDELPELWNILKGDMSVVGPRPLLVEYLPYYSDEERRRHMLRPGLTGWAQVNGRNNIRSWEERFQYDLVYIDNCSLQFDIKILLLTVGKVFKRSDILVGSEIKVGRLDDARRNVKNEGNYQKV